MIIEIFFVNIFFVYFIIALALSLILVGVSFIFATKKSDPEKISAYECGFDPFDDARSRFDIQFYLVAILFIIFESYLIITPNNHFFQAVYNLFF